ncbi:MAG: transglutaminase-like domain-containing protein [Verrucomicrobiota bacterium]
MDEIKDLVPSAAETVACCENSEFSLLFDGCRPTLDQHDVLRNFIQLGDDCLQDGGHGSSVSGFEMILEGPEGSGRSTTLDAIAQLAIIARGSRVVMLVADDGRVGFAVQRIRRKLLGLHLKHFVEVGTIEQAWQALTANLTPPDICVATPASWEKCLAGSLVREGADKDHVRELMCCYATVLVDDWLDHPVDIRAHLPFIVDKHRLLLESEMIPRSCVFVFPRLTETGRRLAVDRLIGHASTRDETRQVARLRYRPLSAAKVFDLEADAIDEVVSKVAEVLCTEGIASILLRKGIDFEEAARQTDEFRSRFQAPEITVCYCNDQIETIATGLGAILMKAANGPEAVFAIKALRPDDALIMIRVRDMRELSSPERITPLIVDRSGRGMAEAHLLNILRFITPRVPVPHRCWGQLGLSVTQNQKSTTARQSGRLLLDMPETIAESLRQDRSYLADLGAYIALDEGFTLLESVDCHWIPDPGPLPWTTNAFPKYGPDSLVLPEPVKGGMNRNTTVLWKGNEGAELGRSQLHYLETLLLKRHQVFCPDVVRLDSASGVEIQSARFRDNGRDAIHPKLEFSWGCESDTTADSPCSPETGVGGPQHRFIWASRGPDQGQGQEITSTLIERTDDLDRPTPCLEFKFKYRALVRPLLLAPTMAVVDNQNGFREALGKFFSDAQEWGSAHPQFLPGLSYALTRGLELDLPSSVFFGKILAFRLTGDLAPFAKAVVWFVEPLGTGNTLSNAVHELLKEERFLEALAGRMDQIFRQGWEKSPPIELAKFWLPRRLRKPVSLFEWRLVKALQGAPEPVVPQSFPPSEWQVSCPHCAEMVDFKMTWNNGLRTLEHCHHPIAMMVSSSDGRMATPASLVAAWWPDGVSKPSGTTQEARALAVWDLVAGRVDYINDQYQREGIGECWLPPQETWDRKLGDCEDHSILMCSMLRTLGIRSWLVWGKAGDGGHAWVEAMLDGRAVLIEATAKQPLPVRIPCINESLSAYGDIYQADPGIPSRTDGTLYGYLLGDEWKDLQLAEPVAKVADTAPIAPPQS